MPLGGSCRTWRRSIHRRAWKGCSANFASGILHGRGRRPTQGPPRRRGRHTCQHYALGWWIEMRPAASQARSKKYPKGIDCALVARRPPVSLHTSLNPRSNAARAACAATGSILFVDGGGTPGLSFGQTAIGFVDHSLTQHRVHLASCERPLGLRKTLRRDLMLPISRLDSWPFDSRRTVAQAHAPGLVRLEPLFELLARRVDYLAELLDNLLPVLCHFVYLRCPRPARLA